MIMKAHEMVVRKLLETTLSENDREIVIAFICRPQTQEYQLIENILGLDYGTLKQADADFLGFQQDMKMIAMMDGVIN